jgi:hypothetical protein
MPFTGCPGFSGLMSVSKIFSDLFAAHFEMFSGQKGTISNLRQSPPQSKQLRTNQKSVRS